MFGRLLAVFLIVFAALALIGLWQKKRNAASAASGKPGAEDPLEEKSVENVNDLNDVFNRARYVDQDGK